MTPPPRWCLRRLIPMLLLAGSVVVLPDGSAAHGTTVQVSYGGIRPAVLTVPVGTTVHFHNANTGSGSCTLVAVDGSFRSPVLARAEGWHHTFEQAGDFEFYVEEYSKTRGRIIVVEE